MMEATPTSFTVLGQPMTEDGYIELVYKLDNLRLRLADVTATHADLYTQLNDESRRLTMSVQDYAEWRVRTSNLAALALREKGQLEARISKLNRVETAFRAERGRVRREQEQQAYRRRKLSELELLADGVDSIELVLIGRLYYALCLLYKRDPELGPSEEDRKLLDAADGYLHQHGFQ